MAHTLHISSQPTMVTHHPPARELGPCACARSLKLARPLPLTHARSTLPAKKRYIYRYSCECVRMCVNMLTPQTMLTPLKYALTPS